MKKDLFCMTAAALLPGLLLAGCSRRDEATVGTPANPAVVVLSPAHSPAAAGARDVIKRLLETGSGLTVELKLAGTPGEAVKAFDAGLTDAGLVTLEEYLVAREEYGVRSGLQALRGAGLTDYEGALLARPGGPKNVAGLDGKKVGFVGPYSVSGFTLPAIYLEKAGVKPRPVFASGHDEVLKKLLSGEVDAAATYARQAARSKAVRLLAVTGTVPNEPVVFRRGLDARKREALQAAFLLLGSSKEGRAALASVADITGFRPVDDKVYKPLHDLLLTSGKTVYDLVPEGWDIYKLNQPYIPDR